MVAGLVLQTVCLGVGGGAFLNSVNNRLLTSEVITRVKGYCLFFIQNTMFI